MSFAEIGQMEWVPREMKRFNDKQLVGYWWKNVANIDCTAGSVGLRVEFTLLSPSRYLPRGAGI